jgi:hypothetical protein
MARDMGISRDSEGLCILRLRLGDPARAQPLASAESAATAALQAPRGTPRLLGQVVDLGAMPDQSERIYLVNPVRLQGVESEGTTASIVVDGTRTVPVLVIGSRALTAGDLIVALAVGGRWVAESGAGSGSLPCSPCNIPRKNLTVSWVNPVIGNGSAPLLYTPPGQWNSACAHGLLYSLSCPGSILQFDVTYFVSGSCPSGQRQTCSSGGVPPFALQPGSHASSPFYASFTITGTGCPVLVSSGYTSFTITE